MAILITGCGESKTPSQVTVEAMTALYIDRDINAVSELSSGELRHIINNLIETQGDKAISRLVGGEIEDFKYTITEEKIKTGDNIINGIRSDTAKVTVAMSGKRLSSNGKWISFNEKKKKYYLIQDNGNWMIKRL